MPRKSLILSDTHPYHITNRSNNRDFFYLPLSELWEIFLENLEQLKSQYNCRIHAFVLMTNHYHLIMDTPNANLGDSMMYFNRESARQANFSAKRINHFFGGRYKWCLIDSERYYWNAVKYVFRNPVKAGICSSVKNYEYSSLNKFTKSLSDQIPSYLVTPHLPIEWIDEDFSKEHYEAVKKALRRREFSLPVHQTNGRKIILDLPH